MDMSDGANYTCPFVANGCNFRAENFTKLKEHFLEHPKAIILDSQAICVFLGPIVKHSAESKEWASVGAILTKRLPHLLPQIYRIDWEEAFRYESYDMEEDKDEAEQEVVINGQATKDIEKQVQLNYSQQSEESGREDQDEKRCEDCGAEFNEQDLDCRCFVRLSRYRKQSSFGRPRMRNYSHERKRCLKMGKESS
jgi:hypothetical protein